MTYASATSRWILAASSSLSFRRRSCSCCLSAIYNKVGNNISTDSQISKHIPLCNITVQYRLLSYVKMKTCCSRSSSQKRCRRSDSHLRISCKELDYNPCSIHWGGINKKETGKKADKHYRCLWSQAIVLNGISSSVLAIASVSVECQRR